MISSRLDRSRGTAGESFSRARRVRYFRRAAKIASHNNQHMLVESALMYVFDQTARRIAEQCVRAFRDRPFRTCDILLRSGS